MKKFLFLLIFPFALNAQISDLKGVGILKPGILTYAELKNNFSNFSYKTVSNSEDFVKYKKKKNIFIEILFDSILPYQELPAYVSIVPKSKSIFISEYTVAGIYLSQLALTFVNDTLISVECIADSKFNDAMDTKYGKGKLDLSEKPSTCSTTLTNKTYTNSWVNGNIQVVNRLSSFYILCSQKIVQLLNIKDVSACDTYDKQYSDVSTRLKTKKYNGKNNQLKDF